MKLLNKLQFILIILNEFQSNVLGLKQTLNKQRNAISFKVSTVSIYTFYQMKLLSGA